MFYENKMKNCQIQTPDKTEGLGGRESKVPFTITGTQIIPNQFVA